jgi:ribosomal protein S27E
LLLLSGCVIIYVEHFESFISQLAGLSMKIACPSCGKEYVVKNSAPLATSVSCQQCGKAFTFGDAQAAAVAGAFGAAASATSPAEDAPPADSSALDDLARQIADVPVQLTTMKLRGAKPPAP